MLPLSESTALKHKHFVFRLIREPLPLLVLIKIDHTVLGKVVWVDDVRRDQINLVDAAGVADCQWLVTDCTGFAEVSTLC